MRKDGIVAETQITAEPGVPQIVMTREFDAPRELLFRAYTDPELLSRWLGPRRFTMRVDYLEDRDGGRWRYSHTDVEGNEFGFHGVQHGAASLDGIVRTNEFEGVPGHVTLETVTFEDLGGRTLVRSNVLYQSVEDRDATLQAGMLGGFNESMERLDELLAELAADVVTPGAVR